MREDSEELKIYIKMAKTRIVSLYHDTAGACYLSFSGGKDSTVVLSLIKECIEEGLILSEIPAVYCDTGIELQVTNEFVKWVKDNYYSNIITIKPEMSFPQIIKKYGKPFRSKIKSHKLSTYQNNHNAKSVKILYSNEKSKHNLANKDFHVLSDEFDIKISQMCCEKLKKKPFMKYLKENQTYGYFVGTRAAEGGAREMRYEMAIKEGKSPCTRIKGDYTIKSPIIDWSDDICKEYVEKHNVPLSKAYTQYGRKRTGCFLCPFNLDISDDLKTLSEFSPNQYKAALAWMKDIYIAQNVVLPFDKEYEREREETWRNKYSRMRYEMLVKYRPDCKLVKDYEKPEQLSFFD